MLPRLSAYLTAPSDAAPTTESCRQLRIDGRAGRPRSARLIAIHFAHRVGAVIVCVLGLATAGHVLYHHRREGGLRRPAVLLLALLAAQFTLGALTVLSGKHYVINSLHVVTGALVLGTSLVLTLRAYRARFGMGSDPIHDSTQGVESSHEWGLTPGVRA